MRPARTPGAIVARRPDVLDRRSGEVVVLLRRGTGEVHRLEGPAAAVWTVADEPIPVDDLVAGARSAAGPGVDAAHVEANVVAAIDALAGAGLVAVTGPTPTPDQR